MGLALPGSHSRSRFASGALMPPDFARHSWSVASLKLRFLGSAILMCGLHFHGIGRGRGVRVKSGASGACRGVQGQVPPKLPPPKSRARPASVPDAGSIPSNPATKAKRAAPFGAARFASMVEPASTAQFLKKLFDTEF